LSTLTGAPKYQNRTIRNSYYKKLMYVQVVQHPYKITYDFVEELTVTSVNAI